MEAKLLQLRKVELPIDVTLDGIVIDVNLLQQQNAESLIDITLCGML